MKIFSTLLALIAAFAAALLLIVASGEPPQTLWATLVTSLSPEGLGYTLYYTTPLIFTGLGVSVGFHCGLFNIGSEGQLYLGSLAVIVIAILFPSLPWPIAIFIGVGAASLGGALWGGLAGGLKAYRGSHEVIVTILLNFVAFAIVDYSILYLYKDPLSQSPETLVVPASYTLSTLSELGEHLGVEYFRSTPANTAFFLALVTAFVAWWFLFRSRTGFELRAVGSSPKVSVFSGIRVNRVIVLATMISGGLSGLVGVNEVMGYEHRLIQGFSPGYGFTGIAVALLGRNHPLGVVLSAFLFGTLHNMSREIEFMTTNMSKELSLVMQAILIGVVALKPPAVRRSP